MRFCSYGRKSVYSDHSDSIDNQSRMCREYVDLKFSGKIDSYVEYSDEDFTGANTNRPGLKNMLSDIQLGLYDVLVVYQLDRLSRDVRDFANIYAMLEDCNVMFVSIKENIDTATPIGRAMMYVTVVFAQMERETIASRVTDNMIGLAKKGYWVGGNPPDGYIRARIVVNGKQHCTIEPDPEGVSYVQWIFSTFLNNHYSLQNMETEFRKQGIRTRRGAFFSTTQLHSILTSPYCVAATPEIYDYFSEKGCQMDPDSPREKWNGSVGVMVYGRTTERNKKHQKQPPEKWLVCLGVHKPFISADQWLEVQARFSRNKFDKTMKYDIPLLKGVLRCSCGSIMCASRKKKKEGVSTWYYCLRRMRQGRDVCDRKQIKSDVLDEKVLDVLRSIDKDHALIHQFVKEEHPLSAAPDPQKILSKIHLCEQKISRLASSLALAENSPAQKYILSEMEHLDVELQALKREYHLALSANKLRSASVRSAESKAREISKTIEQFDSFSASERNQIIRDIVKECTWDGERLFLVL
ncbi:MAG: recombinase family protein [Blautia sp.]|nr:recombinase family protein [Blautia sp.]MDY5031193.1 recombinase family protein [Blautia sp.]